MKYRNEKSDGTFQYPDIDSYSYLRREIGSEKSRMRKSWTRWEKAPRR